MMLCSRCKKRPAAVFISTSEGGEMKNEGLCLICAKEMHIPQVDQYIKQMGITDEDLEQMCDQMAEMTQLMDGESFEPGGAETAMPSFLKSLFGNLGNMMKEENLAQISDADDASIEEKPQTSGGAAERSASGQRRAKEKKKKYLGLYCTHLTGLARDGKLDHIIGRENEIYRVVQILNRRTKNNPCLIGEPGVGKTAIAEGIAQKIVAQDVPFRLLDKEVYLLDLTALVAGTQFRGQFESRVKGLIDEVKAEGNVILFIDEIHNLVGTGDSEGSMNAANILKPALSRGEIQVIGATTFNEYRKYIEKDSALERRFQPVTVNEPTIEDTVQVLLGIKEYYERHHKIHVSDEIVRQCAVLSERYITDRFLPDKAIDLLDESCSCAVLRNKDIAEYEKMNRQLKILTDKESELEQDVENPDYEQIAKVKLELIQLRERIKNLENQISGAQVTEADVAKVIELWTGIPAMKIQETEFQKISGLEKKLKEKIIGQDEAVHLVSDAIKRSRVSLSKRKRPASFIFVGPTGVGKTELVKVLANELFDTTDPLIRLDMSEFMEKHAVSRIIGSPPGYVGYDEAGQLTEKIRRRPYSVVLFDEIEKAHPDVMNILLQILDEGKVTDAHGKTVSFENTVIAMTSNAGSSDKQGSVGFNRTEGEIAKEKAMKGLTEFLRPEFISRVDEIVVFQPLSIESYQKIAALMLDEMREPLKEKSIELAYDDKALKLIADKTHDGKYGARDIRRFIREQIENRVANLLVDLHGQAIQTVSITADGDDISVTAL